MKLSTRSRYGLRLMFELAVGFGSRPVMLKDIADRQKLSEKYLSKLIILLRTAKLVNSVRGAHGGYRLARPPAEIALREVLIALEGDLSLVDCTADADRCELSGRCPTRDIWCGLNEVVSRYLAGITLEDLVKNYRELADRRGDTYCI